MTITQAIEAIRDYRKVQEQHLCQSSELEESLRYNMATGCRVAEFDRQLSQRRRDFATLIRITKLMELNIFAQKDPIAKKQVIGRFFRRIKDFEAEFQPRSNAIDMMLFDLRDGLRRVA